jgi:prepilin-type N-terminal cleavage/methylation domain-containing protein
MTHRKHPGRYPAGARGGFTLVEMLMVLGIIAVLIGLLFPVYLKVRLAGYTVNTEEEVNVIAQAITRYNGEIGSYPGPFSNTQIEDGLEKGISGDTSGNAVTMSENLVLGLEGGLSLVSGAPTFNASQVGSGPLNLNPLSGAINTRYAPFLDANMGSNLLTNTPPSTIWSFAPGRFVTVSTNTVAAQDTDIPEYLDRFPDALPILYMRARVGATGVISNSDPAMQYDLRQITPYVGYCPAAGGSSSAGYIGVANPVHGLAGLWVTGSSPNINGGTSTGLSIHSDFPNNALWYFENQYVMPTIGSGPLAIQTSGTPRRYNECIRVATRRDRLYGTQYDITNFGEVTQ